MKISDRNYTNNCARFVYCEIDSWVKKNVAIWNKLCYNRKNIIGKL